MPPEAEQRDALPLAYPPRVVVLEIYPRIRTRRFLFCPISSWDQNIHKRQCLGYYFTNIIFSVFT